MGQPYILLPEYTESKAEDEVREQVTAHDCAELVDLPAHCPGDDRIAFSVSETVASLPGGTVELSLRNHADERFNWNPYGWRLQKYDGSQWHHVAPVSVHAPIDRLSPGESHTYRLSVDNTVVHGPETYDTTDEIALDGIGPGVYGFDVEGYFESSDDRDEAVAAVFGFAGDAPPVRPTDDVTAVERDGDELVVRAGSDADPTQPLVLSLVDGDPDVELLREQVLQLSGLQNPLSYAATEGIERIRYVAEDLAVDTATLYLDLLANDADAPDEGARFGFRDYVFEASQEAP